MSTTHDNQTEQYIEPYTEPPRQQAPTTHDLQMAAAQGDSEAAQQLEKYAKMKFDPTHRISETDFRTATAESLAGKQTAS